jgi:hypothetical protein
MRRIWRLGSPQEAPVTRHPGLGTPEQDMRHEKSARPQHETTRDKSASARQHARDKTPWFGADLADLEHREALTQRERTDDTTRQAQTRH